MNKLVPDLEIHHRTNPSSRGQERDVMPPHLYERKPFVERATRAFEACGEQGRKLEELREKLGPLLDKLQVRNLARGSCLCIVCTDSKRIFSFLAAHCSRGKWAGRGKAQKMGTWRAIDVVEGASL